MLTARDRLIVRHIEKHGFITNKQALEIFMDKNTTKCKEVARRRLKAIMNSGMVFGKKEKPLLLTRDRVTDENVYYYNKPPRYRSIQLMDFYARLIYIGINVKYFKIRLELLGGNHISDAFLIYEMNGADYMICLEVCYADFNEQLKSYEELYKTQELQKKFGGVFPKIVTIGCVERVPKTILTVVNVKDDLSDIELVFQ